MRLIDADALKARIIEDVPGFLDGGSSITKAFIMAMLGSRAATPTIDAVPVIRCKDCIFPKNGICRNAKTFGAIVKDDWFCADGKRNEGR